MPACGEVKHHNCSDGNSTNTVQRGNVNSVRSRQRRAFSRQDTIRRVSISSQRTNTPEAAQPGLRISRLRGHHHTDIFVQFQIHPDNLTITPAFECRISPLSADQCASARVCRLRDAAPTSRWLELSCYLLCLPFIPYCLLSKDLGFDEPNDQATLSSGEINERRAL